MYIKYYAPIPQTQRQVTTRADKRNRLQICCCDCDFAYYGQTDRALKTGMREHERTVSQFDQYSKVAKHAEQYDHRIDFINATIVNRTKNYRERLFLEAWYSLKDHNTENDHVEIGDVYKTLIC